MISNLRTGNEIEEYYNGISDERLIREYWVFDNLFNTADENGIFDTLLDDYLICFYNTILEEVADRFVHERHIFDCIEN